MKVKAKRITRIEISYELEAKKILNEVKLLKMFRGFRGLNEDDYNYFKWRLAFLQFSEPRHLEALRQLYKLFKGVHL